MSCNRENVIWISKDGKSWNIGFYDFHQIGEDHEWDVEYDYSRFFWASTGHPSEDAAMNAWDGANPGGSNVYSTYDATCERFDKLVQELRERNKKIR